MLPSRSRSAEESRTPCCFLLLLSLLLAPSACDGDASCGGGATCTSGVSVHFREPIRIDQRVARFEVSFDGRLLTCRSTLQVTNACDPGITLVFNRVAEPTQQRELIEGIELLGDAPAFFTVRVRRIDEADIEASFQPTYEDRYVEAACATCRSATVEM